MSVTSPARQTPVLVLGGYGVFGHRLCKRLVGDEQLHVIVAGRRKPAAADLVDVSQRSDVRATLSAVQIDAASPRLADDIAQVGARIVVNLCGPFQRQDYRVAEACVVARAHYIDLADARDFVCGIRTLHSRAKAADVLVTSGASSVPALSSAVVSVFARQFSQIDSVEIGISPGNRTARGTATVASILAYCGEPVRIWKGGRWARAFGWKDHTSHRYPAPVGRRWLALCDVPDLSLLPERYGVVRSVVFRAGLELSVLHFGLALLSVLRRSKLVPNLQRFAAPLTWIADRFRRFGTDVGAMHVTVIGTDHHQQSIARRWTLVATNGDGPFVPTLAATAAIRLLARSELRVRGAWPCIDLLGLDDILVGTRDLAIRTQVEQW